VSLLLAANASQTHAQADPGRKEASLESAHRRRRIIYYNAMDEFEIRLSTK